MISAITKITPAKRDRDLGNAINKACRKKFTVQSNNTNTFSEVLFKELENNIQAHRAAIEQMENVRDGR